MAICVITTQKYRHFSLIAGVSHDEMRELTAFSNSYSATGGTHTRTRTRLWLPIEYEYEYRFTEYEYDFDMIDTGDQREVSKITICQYF
jgi:hypothetical protein